MQTPTDALSALLPVLDPPALIIEELDLCELLAFRGPALQVFDNRCDRGILIVDAGLDVLPCEKLFQFVEHWLLPFCS